MFSPAAQQILLVARPLIFFPAIRQRIAIPGLVQPVKGKTFPCSLAFNPPADALPGGSRCQREGGEGCGRALAPCCRYWGRFRPKRGKPIPACGSHPCHRARAELQLVFLYGLFCVQETYPVKFLLFMAHDSSCTGDTRKQFRSTLYFYHGGSAGLEQPFACVSTARELARPVFGIGS